MAGKKKSQDMSARRRKMARKSKVPWGYIIPALIILVVIVGVVFIEYRTPTPPDPLPPTNSWSNPVFPCLGSESLTFHIHPWLRIVINGQNVSIPGAIGIENPAQGTGKDGRLVYGGGANSCFEYTHTHDFSGIIHIESPTDSVYTLSQFFDVWAQTYQYEIFNGSHLPIVFNSTDILGYKVDSTHSLKLLVDGNESSAYGSLNLDQLDYCSLANSASSSSPCYDTAGGDPAWSPGAYPYGTGHTIVIVYASNATA